jgi:hypothetical protein
MKTPNKNEKITMYESFLHKINMCCISGNNDGIKELVGNADIWSYSHRCGEFISDKQRDKSINIAFWKLCDTPETDAMTKERQRKYTEAQKQKTT